MYKPLRELIPCLAVTAMLLTHDTLLVHGKMLSRHCDMRNLVKLPWLKSGMTTDVDTLLLIPPAIFELLTSTMTNLNVEGRNHSRTLAAGTRFHMLPPTSSSRMNLKIGISTIKSKQDTFAATCALVRMARRCPKIHARNMEIQASLRLGTALRLFLATLVPVLVQMKAVPVARTHPLKTRTETARTQRTLHLRLPHPTCPVTPSPPPRTLPPLKESPTDSTDDSSEYKLRSLRRLFARSDPVPRNFRRQYYGWGYPYSYYPGGYGWWY
ncbi:hypothetical protein C8J57DRAFT_1403334 [Mycena rebaudengoi]|nr:hypothetical protein C8J57DRAFT_1403334 [Mycena rebaudengoi]